MYELALFAGAGGGLLATKHLLGWRTVCYVENARYPVEVLKARIADGLLDDAPIWGDARTFDGRPWRGCVDIITAGFPCQPFSQAGKGLGEQDERNLWPDTIRIIREVQPTGVVLENVSRLLSHAYIGRIFGDLAESGYDSRWDCIPASAVGANHQRDRVWIVAYSNAGHRGAVDSSASDLEGENDSLPRSKEVTNGTPISGEAMAHTHGGRLKEHSQLNSQAQQDPANRDPQGRYAGGCCDKVADSDSERWTQVASCRTEWWQVEPQLGRVADGVAHRVDRLEALGAGQVPAVVATVWRLLTEQMS